MRTRKCAQLWIVEAVWDGRIKGDECTAFERHLKTCRECQEETEILAHLRSNLRALPTTPPDPLSSRRQKQRLLATLDASTLATTSEGGRGRALLLATLLAAAVALVLLLRQKGSFTSPTAARTTAEATIKVTAGPGARWYQTSNGDSHRVELVEGSFLLRITRPDPASRVIIAVPDGEIEDLGTVLSVTVDQGRTHTIAVTEGEVVVRLRGTPERQLYAGDSWLVQTRDPASANSTGAPTAITPTPSALTPSPQPTLIAGPRKRAKHPTTELHREHAAPVASSISLESQAAEDSAYREVLRLLHTGKEVEARDLAGEYLLRFPAGFRRLEMLDVAKGSVRAP